MLNKGLTFATKIKDQNIRIQLECSCRTDESHQRGQKLTRDEAVQRPWLKPNLEVEIFYLPFMDRNMMDYFSPLFLSFQVTVSHLIFAASKLDCFKKLTYGPRRDKTCPQDI